MMVLNEMCIKFMLENVMGQRKILHSGGLCQPCGTL